MNEDSKIVIGILQIAEAPMYVKMTESFASFLKKE
jgi:hypothetical protein